MSHGQRHQVGAGGLIHVHRVLLGAGFAVAEVPQPAGGDARGAVGEDRRTPRRSGDREFGRGGTDLRPLAFNAEQRQIDQDHVGVLGPRQFERFAAVAGLADQLQLRLLRDQGLEAGPEQLVIIRDQDSNAQTATLVSFLGRRRCDAAVVILTRGGVERYRRDSEMTLQEV